VEEPIGEEFDINFLSISYISFQTRLSGCSNETSSVAVCT